MKLSRLLGKWWKQQNLVEDRWINDLQLDSRQVRTGDIFCSLAKDPQQQLRHIQQALQQGAAVILVDSNSNYRVDANPTAQIISMPKLKEQLPEIAISCYGKPSLNLFAVTGTNGKTSVAWMASQLLTKLGMSCGYIGTLGCKYGEEEIETGLTTPDIFTIYQQLAQMAKAGIKSCIIEASSHALVQQRIAGLEFSCGIFTNLTRDHLDYHGDMDSYRAAKWQLWDMCNQVIANADDPASSSINAEKLSSTFGFGPSNCNIHLQCTDYRASTEGLSWKIQDNSAISNTWEFHSPIVGRFMLENLLAVTALAKVLGYPLKSLQQFIAQLEAPPGRIQKIHNQPAVLVDYAHTPDAFQRLLTDLREICNRDQRIGVVFGCGGDRDKGKRPQMGKLASTLADRAFITSDNPRNESPEEIIKQIIAGVQSLDIHKLEIIADRRDAIGSAINWARMDDCLVIAGKGHEKQQICGKQKIPFDDVAEAHKLLNQK